MNQDQIGRLKEEIVAHLNDAFFEGNHLSPHVSRNNQSFFHEIGEPPVTQKPERCLVM